MKKIVVLLMVLVSLLALTAASADSPTASLVALVNHLRALDFEAASQILVDPQQGAFLQEAMKDPVQAAVLETLLKTVEVTYGPEDIQGEAVFNLNAYLEATKALLPEDADAGQVEAAIREALDQWEWKGMAPHSYQFRYHLVLVEGLWKLDHAKAEAL